MKGPSIFFLSLMNGAAWGGSEELWYRTALHLARQGRRVACALYDWPEKKERLQNLQDAGCLVFLLPNKKTARGNVLTKIIAKQRRKRTLKSTVANLPFADFDLVVVNQGGLEILTKPWSSLRDRLPRYALLFHNYNEADNFSAAQKNLLRSWAESAGMNLFAAHKAAAVLQTQASGSFPRVEVFLNPVSFAAPAAPLPVPSTQEGNIVFSVFAALDVHRKAQDKLLFVLSTPKWKERTWVLHLFGEGRDKELLRTMIEKFGLQHKVFLKGHTNDVRSAMQASHLVLQLTAVDAMPLSVVEAMAVGRPLVVSLVGDMPRWVRHGENGWCCAPTVQEMDTCLEEAWTARERWEVMGKQSFAFFQERFPHSAEENFAQQLEKVTERRV